MDETMDETPAHTDHESFSSAWPGVLVEMKDYIDLWFLALGGRRRAARLTVYVSKTLVPPALLQPHAREFKAALPRIEGCRIELKGTEQPAHRIEIEFRR